MQRTSADLHRVPPRQRRQLGLLLSPVAAVLLIAGALLGWLAGSAAGHLIGGLVALLALVLLGIGYGMLRSARADEQEQRLDDAIRQATGPCGTDCGTAGNCSTTDCAVKALPRS
jgi:Flp pilus assembly protein TadB